MRLLPTLAAGLIALALAAPVLAHEHMYIGATAKKRGTLELQYDFARAFPVVPLPGTNQYLGTDPAFTALVADDPANSVYRLRNRTPVSMVVVSMDQEVTVIFNGKTLKKPGDRQLIGRQPYLHQHPEWYLMVPPGTTGSYHLSFKIVAPGYRPSVVYDALVSNEAGPGSTLPSGGTTTTTLPDPCPPLTPDPTVFYCRIDQVPPALDTVAPGTIAGRRMLARLYRTVTDVRGLVQTGLAASQPKTARMLGRADKKLTRFLTTIDTQVTHERIAPDAGDRIRTAASAAYDALTLLRSTGGP